MTTGRGDGLPGFCKEGPDDGSGGLARLLAAGLQVIFDFCLLVGSFFFFHDVGLLEVMRAEYLRILKFMTHQEEWIPEVTVAAAR